MKINRPLLRYFGGKWQLRHWIADHFPEHRFYAEPFCGAASVLLAKAPAVGGEIINDLNRETINLFRVMQNDEQRRRLIDLLEWTPYSHAELLLAREPHDDPVERARRTVIRSFFSIAPSGMKGEGSGLRMGGVDLSRLDKEGKRTFRNCAADWDGWKLALPMIGERLSRVMIYEKDALEFIRSMSAPDCLLYVDPPYAHETRSNTRYEVDFDQHLKLAETLVGSSSMVVLSGYDSDAYSVFDIYGWRKVEKEYRANMSDRRRVECLWISPNCDVVKKLEDQYGAA